jgi:hypothetical protein
VTYLGLDPGVTGGIAAISNGIALAFKMPETDRDILDLLRAVAPVQGQARAVIEKVNPGVFARPGHERKMGVVSAFTFGGGYRALKMALTACDIPYDEALPVKWQNALSCRSKGNKNITKARAQQLFPQVKKVTHAIADALLIAEYCRRLHSGAALPATPAQQELFHGKEEEIRDALKEFRDEAEDAHPRPHPAQTPTVVPARNGRPRHRRHRESRA